MKNNIFTLIACGFLALSGVAQEQCTPHDHPGNPIRSKAFMDAGGQRVANDFIISANTLNFSATRMEANLWTKESEISYLDIIFYTDDNNHPGTVVGDTLSAIVPTSQEIIDTDSQDNFDIRKVILDFPTAVDLSGTGTEPVKYWVELVAYPSVPGKRIGWELNGVEVSGEGVNYTNSAVNYWMVNETWDGVFSLHGQCTVTEGCHIPEAVTASEIGTNEATISWTGTTDATSYILEYGPLGFVQGSDDGTIVEISSEFTSYTITGLDNVTAYQVYVKTICTEGESIPSVPLAFTTSDFYCEIGNLDTIEPITYVEFAGIENRSPSGLNDAPAHEYFLDIQAEVVPGETYTIVVEGNTGGPYEDGVTAFFDWNQDNQFNNSTERYDIGILTSSTGEDGFQISAQITVPANALPGVTRMRLMKEFYANAYIIDGCTWISYGQAEDYQMVVGSLGIEDQALENINLFPNPVHDVLNIKAKENLSSVAIYNLLGQEVLKSNLNNIQESIDVSALNTGVYLAKVEINGKSKTYKIIKK